MASATSRENNRKADAQKIPPLQFDGNCEPLATFQKLPMILKPTLLIDHERPGRSISRLLPASCFSCASVVRSGGMSEISCAKAVYVGLEPSPFSIGDLTLPIRLFPSRKRPLILNQRWFDEITQQYESQFLMYLLQNMAKVHSGDFDAPTLEPAYRILAVTIGQCIVDAPAVQGLLVSTLRNLQECDITDRWVNPVSIVVEALLSYCHGENEVENERLHVGRIATRAQVISIGRGEAWNMMPKGVGSILRTLGFVDRRDAKGYWITFNDAARRQVHGLAQALGVPALLNPEIRCEQCAEAFGFDAAHCDIGGPI